MKGTLKRVGLYPPEEFGAESRLAEILKYLRWPLVEEREHPELRIWLSDKPCTRDSMVNSIPVERDKWLLGTVFRNVFGYDVNIEPKTYQGWAIKKVRTHGIHGVPIKCPYVESGGRGRSGFVYQKLITNHANDSHVEEWRISLYRRVIGKMIVSRKWLLKDDLGFSRCERRPKTFTFDVGQVFSRYELNSLWDLAGRMGVNIGDLDVIRGLDGKLYVVDATVNTSVPPMKLYKNCTFDYYIARHAEAFKEVFG